MMKAAALRQNAMKTLNLLFAICMFVSPAWARIGETMGELILRYGEGSYHVESQSWSFEKKGLSIIALMHEGRCVQLSFMATDELPGPITEEQAKTLMAANSGGREWVLTYNKKFLVWTTKDHTRTARLVGFFLLIEEDNGYASYKAAQEKEKKARDKAKAAELEGF